MFNKDEWHPCVLSDQYIINHKYLWGKHRRILVTYVTSTGKRGVREVMSQQGRIMTTKVKGDIIAWREMPEPYDGPIRDYEWIAENMDYAGEA